ncbi:MAG: hypothetical protein HOP29_08575 [Phycisphaerales bacterium]|nr:hypothetical protein [Phycisphaerales bacterium]
MPALIASGSVAHASATIASSGSVPPFTKIVDSAPNVGFAAYLSGEVAGPELDAS